MFAQWANLAAAFLLGGAAALAAEPPWLSDPAAAAAQAGNQGKLLLVVHFSGEFTADTSLGRRLSSIARPHCPTSGCGSD